MRICCAFLTLGLSGFYLVSCGTGGGAGAAQGEMGDIASSSEPEVGGISDVPNPTPQMASAAGKSLGQLQRGHEVFMLKCGECHTYMLPQDLDIDEWEDAMPKMIRHAGLPESDERAVLDYVVGVKST